MPEMEEGGSTLYEDSLSEINYGEIKISNQLKYLTELIYKILLKIPLMFEEMTANSYRRLRYINLDITMGTEK